MALSSPVPAWTETLRAENARNPELQHIREQLEKGELDLTLFTSHDGLIFYKGRIYIAADSPLRNTILKQLHESPVGGHSGYHNTPTSESEFLLERAPVIRANVHKKTVMHANG